MYKNLYISGILLLSIGAVARPGIAAGGEHSGHPIAGIPPTPSRIYHAGAHPLAEQQLPTPSISSGNEGTHAALSFQTATVIDDQITITGSDNITNPKVYIDGGFQSGDVLAFSGTLPSGVSTSYNSSTGALSFSGTATPSQWQAVFRQVTFRTTSSNKADRTIKYVLGDMVSLLINGKAHYYEYVRPSTPLSWTSSLSSAASRSLYGMQGYLATITSQTENDFIKAKLLSDGWVGGSDEYQQVKSATGTNYTNQSQTEGKWYWITGPEKGTPISTGNNTPAAVNGSFINWASGEPNNSGSEHYIQLYSSQNGKWNDLPGSATGSVPGYVVEYGGYPSDPVLNIQYSRVVKNIPAAPVISYITDDLGQSNSDKITSDRTLRINGTAPANSSVKLTRVGTGVIGTASVGGGGAWSFDYTGTSLADGTYQFTATTTLSGVESPVSNTLTVVIDATAPDAPATPALLGSSATITTASQPSFQGTAEPNSIVKLYSGSSLLATVYANASGEWTAVSGVSLPEGTQVVTATATDIAGNTSAFSPAFNLLIDRTAPATPAAPLMTDGNGRYTSEHTPHFTGSTEAHATVNIYNGGVWVATVTADNDGKWSYTFDDPLVDGDYTITTRSTDAAGNTSAASSGRLITIDSQAPAKPSKPQISGTTESIINSATPSYTGKAEPNSTVHIYVDGNEIGTTAADGSGNWSFPTAVALSDGQHTLTVKAADAAGNLSTASDGLDFTVDTQAPATPAAPTLNTTNNGGIVKISNPAISGSTEPNAEVQVYDGSNLVATLYADASGNWTHEFNPALGEGAHVISVRVKDAAGNTSAASPAMTITVDTQAPGLPSTPVLTGDHNGHTNDNTPLLIGAAEANATVTIYHNGQSVGTTTADGLGNWSYELTTAVSDGDHEFKVTATDAAGNTSGYSSALAIHVDTQQPEAPNTFQLIDDHNGYSQTNKPTLTGKAEAGTTVTVYNGEDKLTTVIADEDGNWSYSFTNSLPEGPQQITATAMDLAHNTSDLSSIFNFVVDTQAPQQSAAPVLDTENNGGIVKTGEPAISGSTEANASAHLYIDGGLLTTVSTDESGNWNYSFDPPLTDGIYEITVKIEDAAGNTGPESPSLKIVVDTQAPQAPASPQPSGTNEGFTNNNKPVISGSAEPNATVTLYSNGSPVATLVADASGNWTYTFDPALEDGDYTLEVTATDAAGNNSDRSALASLHIDTQNPDAPSDNYLGDGRNGYTNTNKPAIGGKAEPGAIITLYYEDQAIATVVADDEGNWSYTFTQDLEDGTHRITGTATDKSGNTSSFGEGFSFIVDTHVPGRPASPESQHANANGKSNNNQPSLNGVSEPGATITIYNNGIPVGTAIADENGRWEYTFNPPLGGGGHSIQTTATDTAGNTSPKSEPFIFEVDTQAPGVIVSADGKNVKGPFTATFTFDEPVENFSSEKIVLVNATGSNLVRISETEYSILVTPLSDRDVKVQLASSAAFDLAGNGTAASNTLIVAAQFSAEIREVYPNPASSVLHVRFAGVVSEKCRVRMVKATGQIVLDQPAGFVNNVVTLNVSHLSSGIYTLIIISNNNVYQKQVMIGR